MYLQSFVAQEHQWREDYRKWSQYLFQMPMVLDMDRQNEATQFLNSGSDSSDGKMRSEFIIFQ